MKKPLILLAGALLAFAIDYYGFKSINTAIPNTPMPSVGALGIVKAPHNPSLPETESEKVGAEMRRQLSEQGETLHRMRMEFAALQWQVRQFKQQRHATESTSADPQDMLEAKAESKQQHHERIDSINAAFVHEVPDPDWASRTEDSIRETLQQWGAADAESSNAECHSHTCRLEFLDASSDELDKRLPMLMLKLGGRLPNATSERREGPQGESSLLLFLSSEPM